MYNATIETLGTTVTTPDAGIAGYTIVAFSALLVYDVVICLSDEITLIWPGAGGNPGAWLYLMNRYLPFVDTFLSMRLLTSTPLPDTCERGFKVVTWMIVAGVIIAEMILMLRTYAIYGRGRRIMIFLCGLLAFTIIPSLVVVKLELDSILYGFPAHGPDNACYLVQRPSPVIIIAYILALLSETIIFGLTLYKAVQDLRISKSPLVVNLYFNGIMYYVYILMISLANVLVPIVGPLSLANWLATPQRVLHSIFSARVLLSIERNGSLNARGTSIIQSSLVSRNLGGPAAPDCDGLEDRQASVSNMGTGGRDIVA